MSLKKELKEKTSISYVDLFDVLFPDVKTKYYDLFIKIIKNKILTRNDLINENMEYILGSCVNKEESEKKLNNIPIEKKMLLYHLLGMIESTFTVNFDTLYDFIKYNEKNLVEKNDLTTYTTYEELVYQTSLANIKETNKELESQTHNIFENNEWLVIRPLTSNASTKYGYGTRWCTAMLDDPSYFRRYGSEGILIYIINKLSGHKVACHKYTYETNITFWSMEDRQIDSLQSGLPFDILSIVLKEINEGKSTNFEILKEKFGGDSVMLSEFTVEKKQRLRRMSNRAAEVGLTTDENVDFGDMVIVQDNIDEIG